MNRAVSETWRAGSPNIVSLWAESWMLQPLPVGWRNVYRPMLGASGEVLGRPQRSAAAAQRQADQAAALGIAELLRVELLVDGQPVRRRCTTNSPP